MAHCDSDLSEEEYERQLNCSYKRGQIIGLEVAINSLNDCASRLFIEHKDVQAELFRGQADTLKNKITALELEVANLEKK